MSAECDGSISLHRSTVRKVVGGAVMVGGGLIALAGLFLLLGKPAPGPARIVQTAIRQRGQTQRTVIREEAVTQRSEARSAQARQRRIEGYRSARQEGEAAATAAGEF